MDLNAANKFYDLQLANIRVRSAVIDAYATAKAINCYPQYIISDSLRASLQDLERRMAEALDDTKNGPAWDDEPTPPEAA